MATTTTLPFTRPGGPATGGAVVALSPIKSSLLRVELFFILALSISILIVATINLRMGNGCGKKEDSFDEEEVKEKKDKGSYPNKTRDYITLTASALMLIVSTFSIIATYPKKV
nr:MAG: wsv414-like protein [Chiromantes dehaani nimavirus]